MSSAKLIPIKTTEIKVETQDIQLEIAIDSFEYANADRRIIDERLFENSYEINALNHEIDRLTSHADGWDYTVALGSGVLAGFVDSFWVGEFDFDRGKAWSNQKVNKFVGKVAKSKGCESDRLKDQIKFLEKEYRLPGDNDWSGKGIGVSAKSHHLDDFAHHPTPIGLFFSILTQFTKQGYYSNKEGKFFPITIENDELIGSDVPSKIFAGTVNWFFHLVSDMSGSNKTAGVGMGIPGPIVSILKEMSALPGLNKTSLSQKIHDLFVEEKFDLRSELAVGHELARQAVPVVINEVMVRAFYFLRRLSMQLKEHKSLDKVNWSAIIPTGNRTIARMLTISTSVFVAFDTVDAAIRSGGVFNPQFLLRINFVGLGRCVIALAVDGTMGISRSIKRSERMSIYSEQLHLMNAKIFYLQGDVWVAAGETASSINQALNTMEQSIMIMSKSWVESKEALAIIKPQLVNSIDEKNPKLIGNILESLNQI